MQKLLGKAASFRCKWTLVGLTLAGCGQDQPIFAPIAGTVVQAGKPLAEAKIVLHPLEDQTAGLPKPIAYADESGAFVLSTLSHGDGAVPGKYAVTVELRAHRQAGEEMIRDGKNLLPARYADPATSGIVKIIEPGENTWEPLEIPAR